ncbi:hypothetical protein VNO78_14915 [Psophocarpus tetragonolobus]|uniref:Uncharacterized protein n=1 Tax=Psophocarpus tetragonolobus TaxID=3891 RepID=A0AAN9SHM5_PSOTE
MMKGSSNPLLVLVMVIWLHANVSNIAAVSKWNDTCDGSVEECLNVHNLESQLPTVSSSHLGRMLAQTNHLVTPGTNNADNTAVCETINGYKRCGAKVDPTPSPCRDIHDRGCHYI